MPSAWPCPGAASWAHGQAGSPVVLTEEGLAGRPPGGRLFLGEGAGRQAESRGKEPCERPHGKRPGARRPGTRQTCSPVIIFPAEWGSVNGGLNDAFWAPGKRSGSAQTGSWPGSHRSQIRERWERQGGWEAKGRAFQHHGGAWGGHTLLLPLPFGETEAQGGDVTHPRWQTSLRWHQD